MIFKKTSQIEIGYAKDIDATYIVFKKQVNEDDFIEAHHLLIEMLNTNKFTSGKHLVDTTHLKIITSYSRKWVAKNLIPVLQQKSDSKKSNMGVVLGCNSFTDFGAEHISEKYEGSVHIHFFSRLEDAKMWLTPSLVTSSH